MSSFKPTHISHKRVEAYPLVRLELDDANERGLIAVVTDGGQERAIPVPAVIAARGTPTGGSVLVRYEPTMAEPDGYLSLSPRQAFEDGYAPIRGNDAVADAGPHFLTAAAWVCHEVNRAICAAFGHDVQPPWREAPDWQRDSAQKGVAFALEHPDAPPSAQHEAWVADKLAQGWTYGLVKDADARTHPCIVPYEELPADQRVKDHAFGAIVAAMRTLQVAHLVAGVEPAGFVDLGNSASAPPAVPVIAGYRPITDEVKAIVNDNKALEERVLRRLDALAALPAGAIDPRWFAIGRTAVEQAFMAINRAVFQPERVALPEDASASGEAA